MVGARKKPGQATLAAHVGAGATLPNRPATINSPANKWFARGDPGRELAKDHPELRRGGYLASVFRFFSLARRARVHSRNSATVT